MDKVTKAIEFAAVAHDGMVRKKDKTPYILHPLEAAVIVGTMTDDSDVISAAVLHDVVEDTEVTIEEIEEKFGSRVRALVESETEDKRAELPPEDTWRIRKEESLDELKNCGDTDVLILWLGDKLSNMRSFYRIWKAEGDSMWQSFNQKDPVQQEWYYSRIAELTSSLKEFSAWQEYNELLKIVFGKDK
ncbi:MAG: HD domain-containing protein [Acutalibacteraceae bacterium]|nr:HD domain-containing protein [Acutalibacteraceae bacterium]